MQQDNLSVIHLTPHFYWPHLEEAGWPTKFDSMGGMQNQLFRQVNFLDQLGTHQLVITLKIPRAPKIFYISPHSKVVGKRFSIFPLRSRLRGMIDLNLSWFIGCLGHVFLNKKFLRAKYQVVHTHGSGVGIPLIGGYVVSKLLKLPLVVSVHCSAIATYKPMSFLDKYLHRLNMVIERKVLQEANHIIFLTDASLEKCAKQVPDIKSKCSIISDSIDSEAFFNQTSFTSQQEFISSFNIPREKPLCLYVGRIAREKGWRDIIEIAHRLKDKYHFLIVGDGNEFDLLKREIQKGGLNQYFTLTGYIAQNRVPVAMSIAKVLTLPSCHEEFGSVLLESMTMGLVSIAYNVGGVSKVISHKENGILVEGVEEMIEQLVLILEDKDLTKKISENSKQTVQRDYQLSNRGRDIIDVYKKVKLTKNA